ncbi:bifunctional diguanylate cyclase/phosphodiesterase [Algicola sagamiensis]|uniref:bifunctional diguanylate cyclase/phosphodiesterase n=1 Tax=Algicola sagamiensis TaxID=163869 RepID=UPI00037E629A|nr:EAL domain-containing protein [Algicola sagamiensis]
MTMGQPPTDPPEDDLMIFAEESDEPAEEESSKEEPWRILMVDDEPQIHQATNLVMQGFSFAGRSLEMVSCYSAQEALDHLKNDRNFACMLIDVVMETDDAGLRLVQSIREDLKITDSRIILRTGQPGHAPEEQVIKNYEIDDYRDKTELTKAKLMASITTALRSYSHITTIETSRKGLNKIIKASSELVRYHDVTQYVHALIRELCDLLGAEHPMISLFRLSNNDMTIDEERSQNEAALTQMDYAHSWIYRLAKNNGGRNNEEVQYDKDTDSQRHENIMHAMKTKKNVYDDNHLVLAVECNPQELLLIHCYISRHLSDIEQALLDIFCANVSSSFANTLMFEEMEHMAFTDSLTNLATRQKLIEYLRERSQSHRALIVADIDSFHKINSGLGYEVGNQILMLAKEKISEYFKGHGIIARLSADTFAIVMPYSKAEELEAFLLAACKDCLIELNDMDHHVTVGFSFGAVFLSTIPHAEQAINEAQMACKVSKEKGKRQFYISQEEQSCKIAQHLQVIHELSVTLKEDPDEIQMHYQPQFNSKTGEFFGMECLVRWCASDGTVLHFPDEFIGAAEDSGLIIELGQHIFKETFLYAKELQSHGIDKVMLAINVSVQQIQHGDFLKDLQHLIDETGVDPKWIELEITESLLMENFDYTLEIFNKLKSMGFMIAIDDFGTGYSSLSYIQSIPMDRMKIDKAFIEKIASDPGALSIATMIVHLGQDLGVHVLAEGVETEEQKELLSKLHCYEHQGYLYSKPLKSNDALKFLKTNHYPH